MKVFIDRKDISKEYCNIGTDHSFLRNKLKETWVSGVWKEIWISLRVYANYIFDVNDIFSTDSDRLF